MRTDERKDKDLREIKIETDYVKHPEGSVLIEFGDTKVICNASVEDRVPPFLRGQGKGWITAEYAMLPRATQTRNIRESSKGKVSGRTMEIQRLIGRSLRSVIDLEAIGERTLWVDCDVIQADGGTRTAAITGAFIAVVHALGTLVEKRKIKELPVRDYLAAISVGIVKNEEMVDLCYEEDSQADVDMNVVMTGAGEFVEIQGTGEEATFSMNQLNSMLGLASDAISDLMLQQKESIGVWAGTIEKYKEREEKK